MEILGNHTKDDSIFLNLYTSDQINTLRESVYAAQQNVNKITKELEHFTERANYCEDLGWLTSCSSKTGKTTNTWRRYRDRRAAQLPKAKNTLSAAQKALNDALASNKEETLVEAETYRTEAEESRADVEGQKEVFAKGKSFGLWAVIILGIGFGGFMFYKKVKK